MNSVLIRSANLFLQVYLREMVDKKQVLEAARKLVTERIKGMRESLLDLETALKNDSKSTAGDKHETSRAMTHLEQEKVSAQLSLGESQLAILENLSKDPVKAQLIETSKGTFLLGPAIGKVEAEGQVIHFISYTSPLGKILSESKQGDQVTINGVNYTIMTIH